MGEGGGGRRALSLFRFHLSPFPPETPDTQASLTAITCVVMQRSSLLEGEERERCITQIMAVKQTNHEWSDQI